MSKITFTLLHSMFTSQIFDLEALTIKKLYKFFAYFKTMEKLFCDKTLKLGGWNPFPVCASSP